MPTLWFCLVAMMLTGYVILDGFDLGAGFVSLFLARTTAEKRQVIESIGPVWDGNEVWLIAAGGTLYFAFPALYASAFSGFYLALMIALWLLILRGISIEFRNHIDSPIWKPFWDIVFGGSSALLALVFGVALGNVVRGVPIDGNGYFFLPLWTDLQPGHEAGVLDWFTIAIGVASFCALAIHGAAWIALKTAGDLQGRSRGFILKTWLTMAPLTLVISFASFTIQPHLAQRFRDQPWGAVFPLIALAGLGGIGWYTRKQDDLRAFLASCLYLTGMLASVCFSLFPYVLPSTNGPESSLTITNAAAPHNGLVIGLWWWIPGMSLAFAYTWYVYRRFSGRVQAQPTEALQ